MCQCQLKNLWIEILEFYRYVTARRQVGRFDERAVVALLELVGGNLEESGGNLVCKLVLGPCDTRYLYAANKHTSSASSGLHSSKVLRG